MTHLHRYFVRFLLASTLLSTGLLGITHAQAPGSAQLMEVRKIWDAAPHNAFTDLIRFHDRWFCVFREGQGHVSNDGGLRILSSSDGVTWESAAKITDPTADLRDAKITITPRGELMLSGAAALHDRSQHTHQSLAWFSNDGYHWSSAQPIGDADFWLWRTTWHRDQAYSIGYGCREDNQYIRLYTSHDGKTFQTLVPRLFDDRYPNETSLVFTKDDVAYCLLRRDGTDAHGLLGISEPPYTQWTWKDLGHQLGGPHLLELPDHRLVAAVRLHAPQVHTGLCWIDPEKGTMQEFVSLPSGGDTSYAGLVWHQDRLWVSYYSSHEGKTSIYLAQVAIGPPPPPAEPAEELPPYPRVNLAPHYQVDPFWPQRPESMPTNAVAGIAVDETDQIWSFTRANPPVRVYRADGTFVKAWGTDVIKTAHHLKLTPDGHVWIADIGLHVVRKFTRDGQLVQTLGTPGVKGTDATHLHMPTDMAITPQGDIFVSDGYGNNRIVHFHPDGTFAKTWGELGVGPHDFSLPHAIALDSQGRLYIADRNNARIQIYDQAGQLLDSWSNLIVPWGFWISKDDDIWVCGSSPMPWRVDPAYPGAPLGCPPRDQLVMKFRPDGKLLQLSSFPKGIDQHEVPGDVNWLHCLAVDSQGHLYLGDIIGQRAQKFLRLP